MNIIHGRGGHGRNKDDKESKGDKGLKKALEEPTTQTRINTSRHWAACKVQQRDVEGRREEHWLF